MSAESFAGIEVPEGEPGALEDAAGQFGAVASSLSGVAGDLRGMPAGMAWSGPASVAYAGSCMTNSGAIDTAVTAFGHAEHAARTFAAKLKDAKQRARDAIRDARDAQKRIDAAQKAITDAQNRRTAAANAEAFASTQISISTAAATPAPEYEAMRNQAQTDQANAADDEAAARRELQRAQDDLDRAKKRGHAAMDDARDAAQSAASAFASASATSPAYAAAGAPGAGHGGGAGGVNWWDTTNEGAKWFDEDAFLAQLVFFHPKNDQVGRYKWWGDRALDAGFEYGSDALTAYGFRVSDSAFSTMRVWDVAASRTFVAGPNGISVVDALSASSRDVTVIDAETLAKSATILRGGKVIPIVGGAVAIAGAGWDQWREDSSNPNLTTTDRVGRSAGVGVYVGGASIAGAAIGTMIFPGVGTGAGLVIGATAGLVAGAVASSITPVKEAMASAGQWTANAAVDGYNSAKDWTGDRIDDIGDGIKDVTSHLPDLNPF